MYRSVSKKEPSVNSVSRMTTKSWMLALLAVVFTCGVFYEPGLSRLNNILDPYAFNGDALQHIAPVWAFRNPALLGNDYILTYYLQALHPPLFKAIYAGLSVFVAPPIACKIVTLGLSAFFILICSLTAWRVSGGAAAFIALLFTTGASIKHAYCMGGLQRGFGFCSGALALYLMSTGNCVGLGILSVVSAVLYPAASVFSLTALGVLLILPGRFRGQASQWSLCKRAAFLAACAVLLGVAVLPQLRGAAPYGEQLTMKSEAEYAEWGRDGRYSEGDRGVPVSFMRRVYSGARGGLIASSSKKSAEREARSLSLFDLSPNQMCSIVLWATCAFTLFLAIRTRHQISPIAARVAAFTIAMSISFIAATVLFPRLYIPSRYLALGLTPFFPAIFPCVWSEFAKRFSPGRSATVATILSLLLGGSFFLATGWLHLQASPFASARKQEPLIQFIQSLPEDTVIAAWPRGFANYIPMTTGRSVLVFEEGHQIFHRTFLEEMRRRMRALIEVFAAVDEKPIQELRKNYNVTHLLIDTELLTHNPQYFAPFDREVRVARVAQKGSPLYLEDLVKRAGVFTFEDFVLVDLAKLDPL